jgi:hypothetical protein
MQCLFCGKELALLKRLRGGGEFCSEAHRKEYQEQYEQLALARLLQAKPPTESQSAGKIPFNAPDPHLERSYTEEASVPAPVATEEAPAYVMETRAANQAIEESSPAPLAGFVREPLVPAVTTIEQAGVIELDGTWDRLAILPGFSALADSGDLQTSTSSSSEGTLPPAPRVELTLSLQALEHHTRTSERGLELREFTGPAPIIELQMRPETGSHPAGADDVMEILMSPHPPQKAKPWLGVPRGFPAPPAELGDLARLDFATTGFAYSDSPAAVPQAATLAPEIPPGPPQAIPEAAPQSPRQAAPALEAFTAPAEPPSAAGPDVAELAPPELVTTALPVTLHGLAAARAKLGQAFPSAMAAASDVQIPPSATLPLRPAIVFGPAPAPARAPQPAAAPPQPKPAPPKQTQSVPAQSVPTQAKPPAQAAPVQPTSVQSEERLRSSVVPAPKPVAIKRPAAVEASAQGKTQEKNIAKTPAPPAPKPRESAAASENTIPSLRLEATESAWSKLSNGVKIGVAAALVVAVSGVAYVVTRGNGKTAPEAPAATTFTPAVATGLAISGGWIDDWANFARSRRHISLLSGSAKLSDYRLEFEAQIETKAIGWIFRGLNPRNYYVTKLEIVTPGLEPTVALVHFAVVDGQDENRVSVPLPMKLRVDTDYKIRFDAIGNHFTTWVQGQKIDEWSDSRFGSGGVGFFSERDEKAAMQGPVNVVPLIPKN